LCKNRLAWLALRRHVIYDLKSQKSGVFMSEIVPPPAPPPPPAGQRRDTTTCVILAGILALILLAGAVVLGVVLVGRQNLNKVSATSEPVQATQEASLVVHLDGPAAVAAGEKFQLTVSLTNQGRKPLHIDSLVLPQSLLQGAQLIGARPAFNGAKDSPQGKAYLYDLTVDPAQTLQIVLTLKAGEQGSYTGSINARSGAAGAGLAYQLKVGPASLAQSPSATPQAPASTPATQASTPTLLALEPTLSLSVAGREVLYQDDFSDPQSGWTDESDSTSAAQYVDDAYLLSLYKTKYISWSYLDGSYEDVVMQVETRVVNATGDGEFGLICRRVDTDNFYGFEISEDGYFTIYKYVGGEYTALYDWEYSDIIPQGQPVTLTASCVGKQLTLYVNGQFLGGAKDNSFYMGGFGMIIGTNDHSGLKVAFDNLVLMKP
jgi:hypothetical protein